MIALDHINKLIDHSKCIKLELSRVVSVKKLELKNNHIYSLIFVANPGEIRLVEAWFESNFFKNNENSFIRLQDTPTRLSAYGNQSRCITDYVLANYCYCA